MDNERADAIFRQLSPKTPKTRAEEMFCELVGRRKYDPQGMLESKGVLEMILGRLDEAKIAELTLLLPPNSGLKLVFTKEEVAERITKFYEVDLRSALLTDLKDGNPTSLYRYVRFEDERLLESTHPFDQEKYDAAVQQWAQKLLLWTNQVTSANVAEEMTSILAEHEATAYSSHKIQLSYRGKVYSEFCKHGSKYVELLGNPIEDTTLSLGLRALIRPEYDEIDSGPYITSPYYGVEPKHG